MQIRKALKIQYFPMIKFGCKFTNFSLPKVHFLKKESMFIGMKEMKG